MNLRQGAFEAILICVVALAPAGISWILKGPMVEDHGASLDAGEVSVEEALSWRESVQWIDARPKERFAEDRAPGAIWLTPAAWDEQIFEVLNAVRPAQPMVVYCESLSCGTSREVADRLRIDLGGVVEVYVLHGGWHAWKRRQP